ncbi:hypothetical protein WMF38_26150 [Sorangium sp. So ce118]
MLGIGETMFRRLEGALPSSGEPRTRVFTPEQVDVARARPEDVE